MPPDLTQVRRAMGHAIKWHTYLTISVDVVLADPEDNGPPNAMRLWLQDEEGDMVQGFAWAGPNVDLKSDSAYVLCAASFSTRPLQVLVNHPVCARLIPEDYDGTDPEAEMLPWAAPHVNGIGVVERVNADRTQARICGLVYFGQDQKWLRYDLDLELDAATNQYPATMMPRPFSTVTFDAVLTKMQQDGVPQGRLLRIAQLQPAHSLLLTELDLVRNNAGNVRAELAAARQQKDKRKVDEMLAEA
ncbi:hypothetical protein OC842_007406 [Tilletia horrida]|uniref:Uncharacterized protein n=1 Tax=Tilletia horrida TaxID=155126 RepID=A0AAN6G5I1_9BASI|nr:hypothetical protein OC842_007406 [Tilletia horrida]KAK0556114.1 hypothetical protein OC844_005937 [Tilletia horrida]